MIGNNELVINQDTFKLAIVNYLQHLGFPEHQVDYIDTSVNGDEIRHGVFMQSVLFGGIFSLNCNNEFAKIACANYVGKLIKEPLAVDEVSFSNYPPKYTILLLDKKDD